MIESETNKQRRPQNQYTVVPFVVLFLTTILLGVYGAAFVYYDVFRSAVLLIGLVTCLVYFLVKAFKRQWRKLVSLLTAFPTCFCVDYLLHAFGVDGAQAAFWVTYPYYRYQSSNNFPHRFKWGEDGIFLGGGWTNTLVYDPLDTEWNSNVNKNRLANNLIGLGHIQMKADSQTTNCDETILKRLGGHWFFEAEYYGFC